MIFFGADFPAPKICLEFMDVMSLFVYLVRISLPPIGLIFYKNKHLFCTDFPVNRKNNDFVFGADFPAPKNMFRICLWT